MQVLYQEYVEYPGVKFFRCKPLWAVLTPEACSRNVSTKAVIQCARCLVGKHHVAMNMPQLQEEHDRKGRGYRGVEPARRCVRCDTATFRLLGGTICVSCYNRQRELQIGVNARGGVPRIAATRLHRAVCLVDLNGDALIIELDFCRGPKEAERVIQRQWPGGKLAEYEIQPAKTNTTKDALGQPLDAGMASVEYAEGRLLR
ncbi:hypothetical protein SAMN06295970_10665 [Noviherbaspirillum suwonense]|uniref:Uncharacterized protein n=1 Tax=Noviherbaspirillum suwonense TaxID=1224511 RepID=A0ABY1Q5M4_9BURK|nr:hypothetical protein SAMN06295970_10665 [Noviherbaspirillum suwonense]